MYFDYTKNIEFTPIVSTSDSLVSVSFKYNFVSDRTQYKISRPSSQSVVLSYNSILPRLSPSFFIHVNRSGLILHSSLSVQARETPSYSPCTQFDPSFPLQSYKPSRGAPASIVLFVLCTAPIRGSYAYQRHIEEQKPNKNFGRYKKTAKIVLAQIRNIVAGMDPKEKDEIYE